jgi:hypothetical protein
MLLLEVSLVLTVKVFTLLLRSALGSIVSEKGGFTVVLRLLDLKLEFVPSLETYRYIYLDTIAIRAFCKDEVPSSCILGNLTKKNMHEG